MDVNRKAPVIASSEIEVAAPIEIVWDVISAIDQWPRWNPAISSASLNGALAPGSVFRWKAGPGTITSTLHQVDPPHEMGWTGKTMGIRALHVYRLDPREGGTQVTSTESWEGLPVRLARSRMQTTLEAALGPGLEALKREAERRAAGTA